MTSAPFSDTKRFQFTRLMLRTHPPRTICDRNTAMSNGLPFKYSSGDSIESEPPNQSEMGREPTIITHTVGSQSAGDTLPRCLASLASNHRMKPTNKSAETC